MGEWKRRPAVAHVHLRERANVSKLRVRTASLEGTKRRVGVRGVAKMALLEVSGYDAFVKAVDANKENTIFAYFTGSKDAQGVSWCPDCVTAEPIVRGLLSELPEGSVFIYCQVGDKPYWKDLKNEFRTVLKVNAVPTLMKYGTSQKLVESELFKPNLVQMLLSED